MSRVEIGGLGAQRALASKVEGPSAFSLSSAVPLPTTLEERSREIAGWHLEKLFALTEVLEPDNRRVLLRVAAQMVIEKLEADEIRTLVRELANGVLRHGQR